MLNYQPSFVAEIGKSGFGASVVNVCDDVQKPYFDRFQVDLFGNSFG